MEIVPAEIAKPSIWTQHDEAEYNRLATEMNEDAKLQFTLFTFGVTASTAVLGLLAGTMSNTVPAYYFLAFLAPLFVLFPTSFVILNRARTRNRKAAYIIVCYDYNRLGGDSIKHKHLSGIKKEAFIPWETALHILNRGRKAHVAPALIHMMRCYLIIESLCIVLASLAAQNSSEIANALLVIFFILICLTIIAVRRVRTLLKLGKQDSIQDYVKHWLEAKYGVLDKAPLYLQEWLTDQVIERPIGKTNLASQTQPANQLIAETDPPNAVAESHALREVTNDWLGQSDD